MTLIEFSRITESLHYWHITEISQLNLSSKHHDKYKFALKLIGLATVCNLSPLEFVQKCQHWQLSVLWEISNTFTAWDVIAYASTS